MKKEIWRVGIETQAITGPTVPSTLGATCGEQVAYNEYYKELEKGNEAEYPDEKHEVVCCGSEVVAIIPKNGSRDGDEVARLVANAPQLLELCKNAVEYLEYKNDFVLEDAAEGNENFYTKILDLIEAIEGQS